MEQIMLKLQVLINFFNMINQGIILPLSIIKEHGMQDINGILFLLILPMVLLVFTKNQLQLVRG